MTEREKQCFEELKGRWGAEHSAVLQWADSHPVSPWVKASEKMPDMPGQYIIVVKTFNDSSYIELAYYDHQYKWFECYDPYDDSVITFHKKDVYAWMKMPDYKNI